MKIKNSLIIWFLILSVGLSKNEYNLDSLVNIESVIWKEKFSNENISGTVFKIYADKKIILGELTNSRKVGVWEDWYENGVAKSKVTYINGLSTGLATEWHENGNKLSEGTDVVGHRIGLWSYWYENGVKSVEANYNKVLQGKYKDWHDNGEKRIECHYIQGEIHGTWNSWYSNGNKESMGLYKKGKKESGWFYWHDNGQKSSEENYLRGKRDGILKSWYRNGNKKYEGGFIDTIKYGLHLSWYENGNFQSEGIFKNGLRDGLHKAWHENAKPKTESFWKNNKLNRYTLRSEDGIKIQESRWRANLMISTYWTEYGIIKRKQVIEIGKPSIEIGYHENGNKQFEGFYQDGKWVGNFIEFTVDGVPLKKTIFDDGKVIDVEVLTAPSIFEFKKDN